MAFDLFPSHISDILFDLNSLKDIDPKHRPQTWLSMDPQHYVAYCPSSKDLRVMFHRVHPFPEEHFIRLIATARKSIKTQNSLSRQDFNRITTRLLRPPGNTTINTDVRALYKLDNNVFVVNALFTFGLFTVKEGEKHIYRSNSAILLCHMPDVRTQEGRNPPTLNRRSFCQEDFTYFQMNVLRPNETYYVPEGTWYLIITLKKSYFIVDKVLAGTEIPGALPFNEHQNYMPDIYNVPPPTPSAPFMRPNDRHKRKAASRDISEVKKPRRLQDVEILSPRPLHSRAATVSRVPPSSPTSSHMHPVQREGDLPEEQHVHSSPVNPPEELHTHSAPVQREGDLPEEQHVHSSPVNPPEDFHIHSASVQRECDPPLNNASAGVLMPTPGPSSQLDTPHLLRSAGGQKRKANLAYEFIKKKKTHENTLQIKELELKEKQIELERKKLELEEQKERNKEEQFKKQIELQERRLAFEEEERRERLIRDKENEKNLCNMVQMTFEMMKQMTEMMKQMTEMINKK
ncbi:hypothetical protein JTE90_014817 [Oedothorax gibbosus]|uniref:JmjC domain-containing protein n=1 Tax=Oedothorax gibbosus TaxID=931172 RepID=A0AAV6TKX9_9ARAC|nr:hypothetical protein JTE90_014817 [Oedothorax gibbosus]